jgi:hypothetical protein
MALNSHLLTITESSIKLDPMKMPNAGEAVNGNDLSGEAGGSLPYVKINGYNFQSGEVDALILDLNGNFPIVSIRLIDKQDVFSVDQFPRDGDILSLRIELDRAGTYKDIRIDFTILEFNGLPTSSLNKSNGNSRYTVRGIMKVPGMYTDECKSYGENTSLEHIKAIAKELKLGVATNIESTNDSMKRFCAFEPKLDLLKNTVLHSYISDDTFQTYSIDPYYYISFVNLQKIFNAENDIELTEFLSSYKFKQRGTDPDEGEGVGKDVPQVELVLTNHHQMAGTQTHIKEYNLVNNSTGIALEHGYRRKIQFFDPTNDEFMIPEFNIESLVSNNIGDKESALKGRLNGLNDEYLTHSKHKYTGIQTDNVHINYKYAAVNNIQNIIELEKMYLEVELESVNPALYKYMKVPIAIYNYSSGSSAATNSTNDEAKEKGFNTKAEATEFGKAAAEQKTKEVLTDLFTLDEFLTGHYIIMGIKYKFNTDEGYTQTLKLARREWPIRINTV